jgi:hypothetical protein
MMVQKQLIVVGHDTIYYDGWPVASMNPDIPPSVVAEFKEHVEDITREEKKPPLKEEKPTPTRSTKNQVSSR